MASLSDLFNSNKSINDQLNDINPKDYNFLNKLNIKQTTMPYIGKGYAETWPIDETGSPDFMMRPSDIPINQHGISVFQPDKWREQDTAGEGLHIDPMAHEYRTKLLQSLSPEQLRQAKAEFNDYSFGGSNLPETKKINNLTDALMRGYTVGQAPDQFNQSFYRPEQKQMLNELKSYMHTGIKPNSTLQDYLRQPGGIR